MISLHHLFHHFITITEHKLLVGKYCFQMGLYFQGFMHDWSKYMPSEFWSGVKYYQGDRSPIAAEREEKGYSEAWLHHKGRNKHHFEYWIDFNFRNKSDDLVRPIPMPDRYIAEMVADRVAACKIYKGKNYRWTDALDFYRLGRGRLPLHPYTKKCLEYFLTMIAKHGEERTFRYIRERFLKRKD